MLIGLRADFILKTCNLDPGDCGVGAASASSTEHSLGSDFMIQWVVLSGICVWPKVSTAVKIMACREASCRPHRTFDKVCIQRGEIFTAMAQRVV